MERSLRQKQSPNWLGDGFTTFAMTSPAVRWSQSIRYDKPSRKMVSFRSP